MSRKRSTPRANGCRMYLEYLDDRVLPDAKMDLSAPAMPVADQALVGQASQVQDPSQSGNGGSSAQLEAGPNVDAVGINAPAASQNQPNNAGNPVNGANLGPDTGEYVSTNIPVDQNAAHSTHSPEVEGPPAILQVVAVTPHYVDVEIILGGNQYDFVFVLPFGHGTLSQSPDHTSNQPDRTSRYVDANQLEDVQSLNDRAEANAKPAGETANLSDPAFQSMERTNSDARTGADSAQRALEAATGHNAGATVDAQAAMAIRPEGEMFPVNMNKGRLDLLHSIVSDNLLSGRNPLSAAVPVSSDPEADPSAVELQSKNTEPATATDEAAQSLPKSEEKPALAGEAADLIARYTPFDPAAVDESIERFLQSLRTPRMKAGLGLRPWKVAMISTAVAGGILSMEFLRRKKLPSLSPSLRSLSAFFTGAKAK